MFEARGENIPPSFRGEIYRVGVGHGLSPPSFFNGDCQVNYCRTTICCVNVTCCRTTNSGSLFHVKHSRVGVGRRASPPNYSIDKYFCISSNDDATWFGVLNPSFTRSWIDVLLKSFVVRCLREKTMIKALPGCCVCHAIWCGRNEIEFTFVNLASTVKKCMFLLYPNRSGTPGTARFSILFHKISGVCNRNFLIKSFSFFMFKIKLTER